jgi:hypothetical protein
MSLQKKHAALPTLVSLILLFPSLSLACDYPYMPSSELYEKASAIFVGKVVESPWKRTVDGTISTTGLRSVRFLVQRMFRGVVDAEVTISGFGDCTYPFLDGETYLVHAVQRNGKLDTGYPYRPLLLSDAVEALKYIEEAVANRTPGLLIVIPFLRGRGGEAVAIAATENLVVHLQGSSGGQFQERINPTRQYEVVAPPGEYSVWLELNGQVVSDRKSVRLTQGKAMYQTLEGSLDRQPR